MAITFRSTVPPIRRKSTILFLLIVPIPGLMAQWHVDRKTDVMTDKTTLVATLNTPVEDNGGTYNVQVNATCDAQSLTFQIISKNQNFKLNPNAISKPRVYMPVRLDQGKAFSVGSASDYPNEAFVRFVHESHDPVRVLSSLGAMLSPITAISAHLIRVELPLNNGDAPILEIRPQDPKLKNFLKGCDFEDDPAPPTANSPLQTLTNRTYAGTVDGFAKELPGFIQRATNAMRLRPEDYAKETASIIEAVRTCARVTPQMYTSLGRRARPDFSQLGTEYTVCNLRTLVSDSRKAIIRGKPSPGIKMEMFGVGNRGSTTDDHGFSVVISFSVPDDNSYRNIGFDNFGIVNATIYSSPSAIKQPVSVTQ